MSKLYDINAFNASLAPKPYCTNNLADGLIIRQRDHAITFKYIQGNDRYIKFLVVDVDHDNPAIWDDAGLAPPNFVIKNRENNHAHLVWALEFPIFKDYVHKGKNLDFFAKIQQAYTHACHGDLNYIGLILKNPNHAHWQTLIINRYYPYTLHELADFIELPKRIIKREAIGEGRNCWLFDNVRKWAYREVLFYKANGANFEAFFNVVLNRLEKTNHFEQSSPLPYKELWHIAKSISKWTWQRFHLSVFRNIQTTRSHKQTTFKNKKERLTSYDFS